MIYTASGHASPSCTRAEPHDPRGVASGISVCPARPPCCTAPNYYSFNVPVSAPPSRCLLALFFCAASVSACASATASSLTPSSLAPSSSLSKGSYCSASAPDSFTVAWPTRTSTVGVKAAPLPDKSTSGSVSASCRAFSHAYHRSVKVCLIARCVSLICGGGPSAPISPTTMIWRDLGPIRQLSGACNIAEIQASWTAVLSNRHDKMTYLFVSCVCFVLAIASINALPLIALGCQAVALLHADPPEAMQVFPGLLS